MVARGILVAVAILSLAAHSIVGTEQKRNLTVTCIVSRPGVGQAVLSLFDSEEDFLKQPVASQAKPVDESGKTVFVLEDLSPKTYAVSVIHDMDSDGELDTGFLGIPSEPVGMSNNAKGRFGPPSFKQCAFELSEDLSIEITLGKAK